MVGLHIPNFQWYELYAKFQILEVGHNYTSPLSTISIVNSILRHKALNYMRNSLRFLHCKTL